jgi:hypothetical protein
MVLAAFSGHVNNREINSNVCNEEATRNNIPAVSHQQNINSIVECVADNNTTVSCVELQPAAENVVMIDNSVLSRQLQCATEGEVDSPSANSSSSINSIGGICVENNTTEIHDVFDESVGTRRCVDLQCATKGEVNGQPPNPSSFQLSYLATLENRINVVETQNQNLQLRITMLEKKVQDLMKPSFSLPGFSMGSSSVIDPVIGLTTFPYRSRGEQKTAP